MAEQAQPPRLKDLFVAGELEREKLHNAHKMMRQIEGTTETPTSDIDPVLWQAAKSYFWIYLFGPTAYFSDLVGTGLYRSIFEKITPNHPIAEDISSVFISVLSVWGTEKMLAKLGTKAVLQLGKQIIKDPEQLKLFENIFKDVDDPGSADAIAKWQQSEKVRISNQQAKQQAEELATRTRMPPEQGQLGLEFPGAPTEVQGPGGSFPVREYAPDVEPEQGEMFEGDKPDFESYQGSTGKLQPEQEQLPLFVKRAVQLAFEFPERHTSPEAAKSYAKALQSLMIDYGKKLFGTFGKKETLKKLERADENARHGYGLTALLYDLTLSIPGLPIAKALVDQAFLLTKVITRSVGTAAMHDTPAAMKNAAMAAWAYKKGFSTAMRLAKESFLEDKAAVHELLKLDTEESTFGSEGYFNKFDNSPTALAYRWIYYARRFISTERRQVLGVDQFSKYQALVTNEAMKAFGIALEEADEKALVGSSKLMYAEARAEEILNEVGTPARKAVLEYGKKNMFTHTFTDQGKLVTATNNWLNKTNWDVPWLGPIGMRNLIMFLPTPAALVRQGINFTPYGAAVRAYMEHAYGNDEIDKMATKAAWGFSTMLWAWLGDLATKRILIGDGPRGDLRDVWPDRKHANSIRIGDHYVGFNHLGPFGVYLSLVADSHAIYHQSDDDSIKNKIMGGMGNALMAKSNEMPFFGQVANFVHAIDSYNRAVESGDPNASDKAFNEFIGRTITGFYPEPVRTAREMTDPVERETNDWLDIVKANTPGWSKELYAKRDRFGHLQYPPVGSGPDNSATKIDRLLNTTSPVQLRGDTDLDKVDAELFRYGVRFTPVPQFYTTGKGPSQVTVPITGKQKNDWEISQGHGLKLDGLDQHDAMLKGIESPKWNTWGPARRKSFLESVATRYREHAKNQVIKQSSAQTNQQVRDLRHESLHGLAPSNAPVSPDMTVSQPTPTPTPPDPGGIHTDKFGNVIMSPSVYSGAGPDINPFGTKLPTPTPKVGE